MTPMHITGLWLIAAMMAGTLAACGGGDDDAPPAETRADLSECHNPSMYKAGSSWTVRKKWSTRNVSTDAVTAPEVEADFQTTVTAAPSELGLGEGAVSWNGGSFFRLTGDKVAELLITGSGQKSAGVKSFVPITQGLKPYMGQ